MTAQERLMSTDTATVVNGQLQLDTPLPLPDNSRVIVTVAPVATSSQQALASIQERLRKRPLYAAGEHFTRDVARPPLMLN
jgi:hypothetical protein